MDITVTNLNKVFEDKWVIRDFSAVFPGEKISCVAGTSGAGKTTLLNILMGLIPPDSGSITGIEGLRLSAVFQEERFCENLSAVRNVALVMPGKADKTAIESELYALGLTPADVYTPIHTLSGGMRRRVAIARALMADYDLLIMDEPFKGLDDAVKQQVIDHVRRRTEGRTVILVTHDLREADHMGAQIIHMNEPPGI